jgi:hypothetical protein
MHMPLWHEPEMRLLILVKAAAAWPDPRSDVGRYLRAWGFLTALRLRRLREAARLARAWPMAGTMGFCRRAAPILGRRIRRLAFELLHRGREDAGIEHTAPVAAGELQEQGLPRASQV